MKFESIKLKDIKLVVKYRTSVMSWKAKNRNTHIIGIAFSGKEYHDFNYQKFNIEKNCVFFFNQRDDYSVKVHEKGVSYSIHFTTYEPIDDNSFCIKVNNLSDILRLFEKAEKHSKDSINGTLLNASCFYQICATINNLYKKTYFPTDSRMLKATEYADNHYGEADCLEKMYLTCDISRRRFDALFKNHFNITPSRYITNRKISYAKELLKTNGLSVCEISELCGFCDVYYFSNVFKKETGYSPSEYKKVNRQDS